MSVSLQKGQKVSLTKAKEGLSRIVLGLGWDKVKPAKFSFFSAKPQEIDCDASALMLQNGYFVGCLWSKVFSDDVHTHKG